ncbi:MAG: carboxypeptidase regulatory-like domain-containing protein [Gemmatimonadaceae bacterium]|nr:carboxypeptidase regulatory-like domain-containing protein [Gemmatimonadaceae bacterium]NUQ94009.1 carboxypeptidase regulatory-like domain-containing protein [Gemmatimonadaceae bacterium]NUR34003.1 carboxypeptidase regulatory-like domain-containing protein [Gemmatimonadaceae bacterium]
MSSVIRSDLAQLELTSVVMLASALALAAPRLPAQQPVSLTGTITDSATGKPVVGALVAAACDRCYGRHPTDSAGRYRLTGLPEGRVTIEAHCPSATGLGGEITTTRVVIAAGRESTLDIRVPPGTCAEPAYVERRGIFRGYYTPGFEASGFIPCADSTLGITAPLLPGKRLFGTRAWADFAPEVGRQHIDWPNDAPKDDYGNETYFVVWRGVLKGPGQYGHMGVAAFSMVVDSVVSVGVRKPADCRVR